jgi:hypothetical protein
VAIVPEDTPGQGWTNLTLPIVCPNCSEVGINTSPTCRPRDVIAISAAQLHEFADQATGRSDVP